jgi:hypothetical protein
MEALQSHALLLLRPDSWKPCDAMLGFSKGLIHGNLELSCFAA